MDQMQEPSDVQSYPLSYGQKAFWLLYSLSPHRAAYNVIYSWRIRGNLDVQRLKDSLQTLIDRHPTLRTTYSADETGQPYQTIHPEMPLHFDESDAKGWSEQILQQVLSSKIYRPINLEKGPIARWSLLKRSEEEHILLMVVQHIAIDKWSVMILVNELSRLYAGEELPPRPELSYSDFVESQQEMLSGKKGKKLWNYWQKQLSGELSPLNLSTDKARPPVIRYRCGIHSFSLDPKLITKLEALAKTENTTLYSVYLAAYYTLLFRYTNQDDILVGTPTAGRTIKHDGIVGYFVSPVVLRESIQGGDVFRSFLQNIQKMVFGTMRRADYPFPLLVENLHPDRDPSRPPLTQVSFTWDDPNMFINKTSPLVTLEKGKEVWKIADQSWERISLLTNLHDFDLNLSINYLDGNIHAAFEYNEDLFRSETIARMEGHFQTLLQAIAENPDQTISQLPLLTDAERQQLLVEWNQTEVQYPFEGCIHHWFEKQVEQHAESVAVIFNDDEVTYHELNIRINQLAHWLQQKDVGTESLVGIFMERSLDMIVTLFAILKAGAAYVSLDPQYPQERLEAISTDAQLSAIISHSSLEDRVPSDITAVLLDKEQEMISAQSTDNPTSSVSIENLCYVIYTSGSTGKPKGVGIEHRSVSSLINWIGQEYSAEELSGVAASFSISFDPHVLDIHGTLGNGGTLVLATNALHISTLAAANRVKTATTVPSAAIELARINGIPSTLETFGTGGELLSKATVDELFNQEGITKIRNFYGPTEDTVISTFDTVSKGQGRAPTIGRPISNSQAYVLDNSLQPVPIGVPGELHLGGAGLARGYLHRPDLTQEKFIPNPFSSIPDARLYKTGDLVRYLPDGRLDFLSRIDHQVKIRGFRIELGDIESILFQFAGVQETIVIDQVDKNGTKFLVGYVVFAEGKEAESAVLRTFVQERLPDFMVPSAILVLDTMPLTVNGKIDRKALPYVEAGVTRKTEYAKPKNHIEKIIAKVWKKVLNIEQIGIHDSFFDMGGSSLGMAQVYAQLPAVLQKDLSVVDLFQYPTIYKLAEFLGDEQDPEAFYQQEDHRVERTRRSRERLKGVPGLKIAVVGMSGRFPGAQNVSEFWDNLKKGVESISHFPDEELEVCRIDPELWKNPNYVKASGVINDLDLFDAQFFGVSPREAQTTDPQHRLFLESSWETLENAGFDPERFQGSIGVYGGSGSNAYYTHHLAPYRSLVQSVGHYPIHMQNDKDFLCSRVSYKLNLDGPGITVQTACSTSLVAVHLACRGLLSGECDLALAGGVSLGELQKGYLYQEGMILSPDGKCRPFDEKAGGTVPSQGVGLVALRRLEEALEEGDHIHAVIIGTSVNNDGANKIGYSAPGIDGQAHVIQSAQVMAGISPESISYVEAHGTGTKVGDPIEISGLSKAFQAGTDKKQYCAIGSVKSNLGHLDSAAGVAGLIKTVLSLKNKTIPPTLHYEKANPSINFEESPFYVNTKKSRWFTEDGPRRAGVSSFGLGGTNAHIVVEEAPQSDPTEKARPWQLLFLSAKTPQVLDKMTENLAAHLDQNHKCNLADVAYTLHVGRRNFQYRRVLVCENLHQAIIELSNPSSARMVTGEASETRPPVVFLFPGQGTQYRNMCHQLYQVESTFRDTVNQCFTILEKRHPDVFHSFQEEDLKAETDRLHETQLTHILLFSFEYALAQLFEKWGIRPDFMMGHSLGEYTAACMAKVFSLEDALSLVTLRGQLIQEQALPGRMLSLSLPEEDVKKIVDDPPFEGQLSLAVVNGPNTCVVAGDKSSLRNLKEYCKTEEISYRSLATNFGFHSHLFDSIQEEFKNRVEQFQLNPPEIPFVSNVTGEWITDEAATDPNYWVQHLRQTVYFSKGLETLFEKSDDLSIFEVGPRNVLSNLARRHPKRSSGHKILSTVRHPQDESHDTEFLLTTLGQLWIQGGYVDWDSFNSPEPRSRIPLPTYPFKRKRYWIEAPQTSISQLEEQEENVLMSATLESSDSSENLSQHTPPQNDLEKEVVQIWAEFLGTTDFGIHEHFSDLGGDSMMAIQLLDKLGKSFHLSIPSHILITHSTVCQLAQYIQEKVSSHPTSAPQEDSLELLVEMQKGHSDFPRLFLIHPGGGHVYFYQDMAHYLGAEQPVCGIQAQGLDGDNPPIDNIKKMATRYIEEIQAFQPEGPYFLGGSSFGGLVAYEMAQQLQAQDIEVPLVILVDTPGPGHMPNLPSDNAGILAHIFESIPLDVEQLRSMDVEEQVNYVIEQAAAIPDGSNMLPPNFDVAYLDVVNSHNKALFSYTPEPYSGGPVLFFKHTEHMNEYDSNPEKAWRPLVEKSFEVKTVPGTHITMNFRPNVKKLCKHLVNKLKVFRT